MTNRILIFIVSFLTILKIAALYMTNFDLFGDEAQYWLWSKNLDMGYYSKPPFLAWSIAVYTSIFGETIFYLKLFPILVYFTISWSIYKLSKNIGLDKDNSFSCALIFLFIPDVTFSSFVISTDIFLLLFWTLSLNELVKIEKKANTKNFILLGIFIGLAFLSKYAAIYYIVCIFIYVLVDIKFRKIFRKNYIGFSLSLLCTIVVLLPNLAWNLNNGWITFQHTSDNANLGNIKINMYRGLEFLIIQILMIGPLIFLGNIINYKNISVKNGKFLLAFSLPIFIIVFIEAVIVRANANWAAPALISFFLFLYTRLNNSLFKNLNIFFNFIFCAVFFILIGFSYPSKIFDRINGLNKFVYDIYLEEIDNGVKNFVISDRLLFASINYELRNKKLNFYMPHKDGSPITNHFMISTPLKKEMSENFIFIGNIDEISYLHNKFEFKIRKTPKYNFTKKELKVYDIKFD